MFILLTAIWYWWENLEVAELFRYHGLWCLACGLHHLLKNTWCCEGSTWQGTVQGEYKMHLLLKGFTKVENAELLLDPHGHLHTCFWQLIGYSTELSLCVALFLKVEAGRLLLQFFSLNTSNETYFECLGFPSKGEIFFFWLKLILGKKKHYF